MRRHTGARVRSMLDTARWCHTSGCRLPVAHLGGCDVTPSLGEEQMRQLATAVLTPDDPALPGGAS